MSSTPSSAEMAQVDVWLARDPELRDPSLLERFSRILSDDETARVQRMQYEAGRHQQLVTRAMAREVLSHYHPEVSPAGWRFERGERGRPSISGYASPAARATDFNLAHAEGLVVMAVGRVARLGVDTERRDQHVNLAVARRFFSAAEAAALDALPPEQRAGRFRQLWTLKEAYLKAQGTGIVGGLGSMTFHFEDEGRPRFECAGDPQATRWAFQEFEIGEHRVALALLAHAGEPPPHIGFFDYPRDLR